MPEIRFTDLEFARVPIRQYSDRGVPWTKHVPVGMPKLPRNMLDCVCYLYGSSDDARAGKEFGGTGFLVAVPIDGLKDRYVSHVVTNWHVAVRDGFSCVRLNTQDGDVDVFEFGPEDWHFDSRYDIAVVPIALKKGLHKYAYIGMGTAVSEERAATLEIGPGEDVFMIGRFVDHDGGVTNQPAVRFGNIATFPTPIEQEGLGRQAKAYCIDIHSRSGYSGSPVFVYRTPGFDLAQQLGEGENASFLMAGTNLLTFLGIHFAQFPEYWEVKRVKHRKRNEDAESRAPLILEGEYVKGLSGMTCVLPAWTIKEVLDLPKLQAVRLAVKLDLLSKEIKGPKAPEAESELPTKDENPQHKEDFNRLLDAAVKGPKSGEKT